MPCDTLKVFSEQSAAEHPALIANPHYFLAESDEIPRGISLFPDRHGVGGGAGGKRTALAPRRVAGRCSLLSATVRSQSHIGLLLRSQFHQQMHFLRGWSCSPA
jgi:hypothetical protein